MARKGIIERRNEKAKPRGKPFPKGHKKGSHDVKDELAGRPAISDERGVVDLPSQSPIEELEKPTENVLNELPRLIVETINHNLREPMNNTQELKKEEKTEVNKDLELIDSLDFMNGENKLSIRFSKRHNRMYRIQVFLNDTLEVRNVTYAGVSTGKTVWDLMNGVMKK